MHQVRLISSSQSGDYKQVDLELHGSEVGTIRLSLVKSGGAYDFRIRDKNTLSAFFPGDTILNVDDYGPLVIVQSRGGLKGAICSTSPGLSCAASELVFRNCWVALDLARSTLDGDLAVFANEMFLDMKSRISDGRT